MGQGRSTSFATLVLRFDELWVEWETGWLSWELLHDLTEPGRYVEQIVDESWTEHLRRFDRISAAAVSLREQRNAFHIGSEPPRVTRFLIEQV